MALVVRVVAVVGLHRHPVMLAAVVVIIITMMRDVGITTSPQCVVYSIV
ncbi:hypothetical protein [Latilactobacillus curvatus]|nr:hypothetical protein [Latilactobacillus curvatus]